VACHLARLDCSCCVFQPKCDDTRFAAAVFRRVLTKPVRPQDGCLEVAAEFANVPCVVPFGPRPLVTRHRWPSGRPRRGFAAAGYTFPARQPSTRISSCLEDNRVIRRCRSALAQNSDRPIPSNSQGVRMWDGCRSIGLHGLQCRRWTGYERRGIRRLELIRKSRFRKASPLLAARMEGDRALSCLREWKLHHQAAEPQGHFRHS